MKKQNEILTDAALLRKKAEEQFNKRNLPGGKNKPFTEISMLRLIHELEVHQIELEMQNEEFLAAKEKAKLAEKKYTELFDFAPSGYLSLSKDGEISELNFAAARMLNQERSRLIKIRLALFISQETLPVFNLFLQDICKKKVRQSCEVIIKTGNNPAVAGQAMPIYVNIDGVFDENSELCLLTVLDITNRKLAEKALKESEEKFRKSFFISPDSLVINRFDDGKIVAVNDYFKKSMGYEDAEVIGKTALELHFFKNIEERNAIMDALKTTGHVINFECWFVTKTGEEKLALFSAVIIDINGEKHTMSSSRDITERKNAEIENLLAKNKAEENENEFRLLAEAMPQIVWITRADGWNIFFNQQWVNYTGLTLEESYGNGWLIPFHPKDKQRAWDAWQKAINNKDIYSLECQLRKSDGTYRWWLVRGVPVMDKNNKIVKWFGTCTDIHNIKQFEKELIAAKETAEENEIRLKIAQKASNAGTWDWDLVNNKLYWSDELLSIFGLPDQTFAGFDSWSKVLHPDDREKALKKAQECIENKIPLFNEYRIIKPNQEICWIRTVGNTFYEDNKPVRMIGLSFDYTMQKNAELALKVSETRYHHLYLNSGLGIFISNLNDQFIDVNPTLAKMLGYDSPEEVLKNITSISRQVYKVPSKRDEITTKALIKSGMITTENQYLRKDGSSWFGLLHLRIVADNEGNPSYFEGLVEDISDKKQAIMLKQVQYNIVNAMLNAKNLNELVSTIKDELNNIIDSGSIFIDVYIKDKRMFSKVANLFGRDEKKERPAFIALVGSVLEQGQRIVLQKNEIIRLNMEGKMGIIEPIPETWVGIPLHIEGKVLGAIVVESYEKPQFLNKPLIEILKMIAQEISIYLDRLRISEESLKLSTAVEQSSVTVIITDKQGILEYVNPFFTKLTGYTFEEVIGKSSAILNSGFHPKTFYKQLWNTILSGNNWEGEFRNKKKNGDFYWERAIISPILNNEGAIINFVAIKEDVTELRKVEMTKIENHRLNVAGELSASIAHDFNNSLQSILGSLELVKYKSELPESTKDFLNTAIKLVLDVSKRVEQLQKFNAKKQLVLQLMRINLNQIINDVVHQSKPLWKDEGEKNGKNISFKTNLNEVLEINGIASDLSAAIYNIIKNSIESITGTGEIVIDTGKCSEGVYLTIQDSGMGMDEETKARIFQPFFTTKGFELGRGLGMSGVYRIIKEHNGKIYVKESKPGEGTTIEIIFPDE